MQRLRDKYGARDARMLRIRTVREGNMDVLFPDFFSETWHKPITSNFIDVAARDLAEAIAPLPALHCTTGDMSTDKARMFAAKKTKVGAYYWLASRLDEFMTQAADRYLTYGFLPLVAEPNFDHDCPHIRLEDPIHAYPQIDRWGRCRTYAKVWRDTASSLAVDFPEFAGIILTDDKGRRYSSGADAELEVIRFSDDDRTVLYLPRREGLVLAEYESPIGRCPVSVARRPGLDDELRGQFDEVIWVQMARAKMALLRLEAADNAVNSPIAVPDDLDDLPLGPMAVWRTRTPQGIQRVNLGVPAEAFAEDQALQQELRVGSRYPNARDGNINASVITGRGIQELMGSFDTQIKTAQTALGSALREVTSMCFEMDEKLWGGEQKTIRGSAKGTPYEIKYDPAKDIAGDYTCEVSYGFAAGLDPNRALVMLLQLRGDKMISRETSMKQLPFDFDVESELRQIDVEEVRDSIKQGIDGVAGAMPQLVVAGQDPSNILRSMAMFASLRAKGMSPEEAALQAFQPPPPPPEEQGPGEPGGPGEEQPEGEAGGGGPFGTAPGQADLGPGGMPPIQDIIAGIRNGSPILSQEVRRRLPAA